MIELKAEFQYAAFSALPEEVHDAIAQKLIDVTYFLYQKVMMNVEGAVLNRKSGQLADSIEIHVTTSTDPMVGSVGPEPATAKAWVLEVGGLKNYSIVPVKAQWLHFFTDGREVFTKYVNHPPLRARHYLQLALDEIDAEEEFLAAIDGALAL